MKNKKGGLIVFEGGEGTGKTTQATLLYQWLVDRGYKTLLTSEPGGHGGVGVFIRKILRDSKYEHRIDNTAEFFLFEAARAQHVNRELRRALSDGKIVVCDRFHASTYAYQVFARRTLSEKDFWYIDTIATGGLKPDFSFLVDLKPKVGLARKNKERVLTRFEKEKLNFHQKVRVGFNRFYKKLVKKDCWQKLNGALPPEKLHEQVLRKLLEKKFLS